MSNDDLGDEVTRLTDALQGWWSRATAAGDEHASASASGDEPGEPAEPGHEHHTGASCRVCPLCRAMDVVRGVRPELLDQVASAAETVAVLLREAARGRDEEQGGPGRWA